MAVPTPPTLTSIVTEGLRQGGIFYPTASQLATYSGDPMEQLKNQLWQELKQAKPLMTFSYMVLTPGQSRYSCPSDYSSDMTMVIMTGLYTGNVSAATANTLTVPISPNGVYDINQVLGEDLVITGGTAVNSVSQIIGLVNNGNGTQTLTVYPNFQATGDATSTYMIVDNQYPCEQRHIAEYDLWHRANGIDRPRYFFPMGDEDYDEFIFDVPPDNVYQYCTRMRYTVNIMTLDLNSTLLATLYLKFREFWIYGIKSQVFMDNDDTRAPKSQEDRQAKLLSLIRSQQYGTDLHNFAQHVMDYQ
jgi:hypothetical protein